MTHRTQLSQAEEALRQATRDETVKDTDALSDLITAVADRLRQEHPTNPATIVDLDDLAAEVTWVHVKHRSYRGHIDRARHGLLHRLVFGALLMPRPTETRGELALRLLDFAGAGR